MRTLLDLTTSIWGTMKAFQNAQSAASVI